MADKSWYYALPGQPPAGPVPSRELRRMAADGRLTRGHFLSRTPDGRQVRADTLPGLFPQVEPPAADNPFALPTAAPPRRRADPDADDDRPAPARRGRTGGGGFFDLGFSRFVTPALIKVLWAVWLFGAVPLLTLAILAQPVLALALPPGRTGLGPVEAVLVAVAGLVGLALYTLVVRVALESTVVLFRGAEAVMAIDARQRRGGG